MLASLTKEWATQIVLTHGRKTYELTQCDMDKGRAVQRLLTIPPFQGRRPVYLGDDVSDVPAIDFCTRNGGTGIRVGRDERSSDAFSSPGKVRAWIGRLAGGE